jgi:hypothetical protein
MVMENAGKLKGLTTLLRTELKNCRLFARPVLKTGGLLVVVTNLENNQGWDRQQQGVQQ